MMASSGYGTTKFQSIKPCREAKSTWRRLDRSGQLACRALSGSGFTNVNLGIPNSTPGVGIMYHIYLRRHNSPLSIRIGHGQLIQPSHIQGMSHCN